VSFVVYYYLGEELGGLVFVFVWFALFDGIGIPGWTSIPVDVNWRELGSWGRGRTAPRVPRTFSAMGLSILLCYGGNGGFGRVE
jgi:hypothetical protein